ncbi:MAG: 50S ribosome-binding GTPase [Planctomycetes bacterium]|nr:50S ribosome-binding GTPase [Planctomycetota bacterium]
MYDLNDTIVAVSSPTSDKRVIVRITGPETIETCKQIFNSPITNHRLHKFRWINTDKSVKSLIIGGICGVDAELKIDAQLYLFLSPHSYTGDDLAEIHIHTNPAVTEVLIGNLLGKGLRMAGPGEFTARAYLNGKIDLAQAEAVNEIIVSSNAFQLAAAEKLLSGRLSETTAKVRSAMMDCLSLTEAGLDFSAEDIELETGAEVIERLLGVKKQLEQLLTGSIRYESLIDLPAVGITGAPNAGKSSLLNKLLGKERSIVSHKRKTTRDVLTALCTLTHCRCVLFDCAGLTPSLVARCSSHRSRATGDGPRDVLDELAQQAAIEALRNSAVVVFCVDISKDPRPRTRDAKRKSQDFGLWTEEIGLWSVVWNLGSPGLIPVATKCDLVSERVLSNRLAELNELFGIELLVTSTETGDGLELLRETIDRKIIELEPGFETAKSDATPLFESTQSSVALTARHKQAVTEAIENVSESISELRAGNDEVAAMMLRAAYQAISGIESAAGGHVDEQILEQIFSRFCIGK